MRWPVAALLFLAALGLQGCGDSGPQGPGPLSAAVVSQGESVGAVVLSVSGPGVTSFQAVGSTRLFSSGTQRVVLVGDGSGPLRFNILVNDRAASLPTVGVVEAVDVTNARMDVAGLSVRVER
ncbi:MAG: hypothetical protein BMS9Abin29_2294 [Gemmatimonadota bacterium]|nr:MAG: hypothetical protein BMS9Abin29_2294 [Gemmatimonadota bacterium]